MKLVKVAGGAVAAILCTAAVGVGAARASTAPCPWALRDDVKVYRATGVIRSFGPERGYVNIAHDAIPGYMGAMTMSFWPQRKEQLEGLAVGDRVAFEFTETEDARRVLATIQKRP